MQKKLFILLLLGLVAFTLWRNYGVIAKGDKLDLSSIKTNEQKELFEKIKNMEPKEGDEVQTSFGFYQYQNKGWIKVKEVWE